MSVNSMSKFSLSNILRGLLVAFLSSIIIGFMVIVLGPLIPFIPFNGFFPLLILLIIFILTFITYFFLPPEISEAEEITTLAEPLKLD